MSAIFQRGASANPPLDQSNGVRIQGGVAGQIGPQGAERMGSVRPS